MASKASKQSRKETKTDPTDSGSNELNMAGIAKLLDEHRQALSAEFKSTISLLKTNRIILPRLLLLRPRHSSFFSQLLFDILGKDVLSSPPEIDRAHRVLIGKPAAGAKPRAVIIRMHHYQQKELIIREARAKRGKLMFQGSPIAIYEDYAPEVMVHRSKYRPVMTELYNLGLRPSLLFPARLSIRTRDGNRRSFSSVSEAEEYVASAWTDST
ncbi:hypothetical protein QQF64_004486 [Cirrhinus molitorella]|uniref:Uncharacterized protein n=1 Tax=Cirrhinus molitorella TaxID=172907 RepID=A0ABR3MIG5_9TELE